MEPLPGDQVAVAPFRQVFVDLPAQAIAHGGFTKVFAHHHQAHVPRGVAALLIRIGEAFHMGGPGEPEEHHLFKIRCP